jgi:glucosylglycerate synthase
MASIGLSSSDREADSATALDDSRADIVVALTSYNDVRTIGEVVRALRAGVARSFGSSVVQFVLADTGSTDGTREAAREAAGPSTIVEIEYGGAAAFNELPYHGHPGRPAALRAILHTAERLSAKACAVVDASLHTVGPEWIERLATPIVSDGFDYVSPYHLRHVNEGAITKSIIYPMFRALYGVRLRQPAASEFGCSRRLVTYYLEQDFWDTERARVGIDVWLAAAAVSGDFRSCEAALGPRGATLRGTPADLSTTLAQLAGTLFADLEDRADVWQRVRGSAPTPVFGEVPTGDSGGPTPNVEGLMQSFRLGYRELREIWAWVLPPRTIVELRKLTETPPDRFRLDDRLWATIIYDFALGYSLRTLPRDHLLRSLTPLYSGWLASFVLQMRGASQAQVEERVEQVCLAFEAEKRYLISRWRWPERRRSHGLKTEDERRTTAQNLTEDEDLQDLKIED